MMIKLPKYIWIGLVVFLIFWVMLLVDSSQPTGLIITGSVKSSATIPGSRTMVEDRMAVIMLENGVTIYLKDNGLRTGDRLKFRQYKSKILGKVTYKRSF